MGWETVEKLPGTRSKGGAFRDGAEPVVAQRIGVTLGERVRLFWHSTPDQPSRRAARWIVVTPQHVYVQRIDGTRSRVRLDRLRGERLERGLLVYGVLEDEDLFLTYRARCDVQDRLSAVMRGSETVEPWRDTRGLVAAILFATACLAVGVGLLLTYPIDGPEGTFEMIRRGFYTSERALGSYGGFGALLLGVLTVFFGPSRWRVDAVGVTRTRGILPLMTFTVSPERFRRARLRPTYFKPKHGRRYHSGWAVELELRERTRVGTMFRTDRMMLRWFSFGQKRTPEVRSKAEEKARALAERLRSLLSLETTETLPLRR